jgi:excisionase family DNA binding protein
MTPALELLTAWYPKAWRDPLSFPLDKRSSQAAVALTVEEAARYLGVTPETLRRLCRKRRIPFAKIGSDYRFRQADLDALFVRGEKPAKLSREESLSLLK